MLSAEHLALQSRLVQQLLTIRQREMDIMLARYQSIGTQAALIMGFSISSLTGFIIADPKEWGTASHLYYFFTFSSILASLHVILTTVFVCNWAPSLALRGPTGSMTRAFDATRVERRQVNVWFCVGLVAFVLQCVVIVWLIDVKFTVPSHSIMVTVMVLLGVPSTIVYVMWMHQRFFGSLVNAEVVEATRAFLAPLSDLSPRYDDANAHLAGVRPTSRAPPSGRHSAAGSRHSAARGRPELPLLDNPTAVIENHPDLVGAVNPVASQLARGSAANGTADDAHRMTEASTASFVVAASEESSEFQMRGYLAKQDAPGAEAPPGRRLGWVRSVVTTAVHVVGGEWRDRYFVLRDGFLQYWHTEADFLMGKPSSQPIELDEYEVLVDMRSHVWQFTLQPLNQRSRQRTWHLRAPSERARLEWSRRLVIATIIGSSRSTKF